MIQNKPINEKNLEEEIFEELEKCFNCGLCKARCPVFNVLFEEHNSPRGRIRLLKRKIFDQTIFNCTLCKSCEEACPIGINITDNFRKARTILSVRNKNTKENKEMIKNIRKFKNPFGNKTNDPKKLYCC